MHSLHVVVTLLPKDLHGTAEGSDDIKVSPSGIVIGKLENFADFGSK